MQYGYFDDRRREYVIANPRTPVPWINYVGTLDFGGFVDHTGGVLICKGDPALNRITRYIPQLPASDFKGATLYLRLPQEGGGFRVFSPFFVPTLDRYDCYECHVGLGYSRFVSEFYGLRSKITVFVPRGEHRLVWDVQVTNLSGNALEVDAIPVVEYTHPDALKQFTNADWVPQTMQSRALRQPDGCTVLLQYPFMCRDRQVNLLTSNLPASSFETDRRRFLGHNEYGTWANPLALQQPELDNGQALRGDNVGALLHHLGAIAPGASRRLIVQLTQAPSLEAARPGLQRFRQAQAVDAALEEMAAFWDDYLGRYQVQTPDPDLDRMLNVHNPRQCYVTLNWSRYLSRYQLGFGARGIGFRDSAQDALGVLAGAPDDARHLLRQLLQVQKQDGSAMHQFNPLTMVANEGDSREVQEGPHYYSDDHLWAVIAVCAYLQESGDLPFLQEVLPFYEKDREEQPLESGTVWEHLRRALAFTRGDVGAHGLSLAGFADWNDTVNLCAGAESLFTANLYGLALQEMIGLARHLGREEVAQAYEAHYMEMQVRVNEHAWDGEWYVRYFDWGGVPLGSRHNSHGQIYANAQSWPVLSSFAPPERARRALNAVWRRLNTRHGIKLSTPGFDGYDPSKGGVTTYPPGAKENGGIFLHANPWVIIAETLTGNGDRAYIYYRQINPAAKNESADVFEAEPYVYPQNILGDEHPQFGLARNSWLTGTASWAYQAATQWILGVRPEWDGLRVDPCIPSTWDGYRVQRQFRGARYEIAVRNPDHVCRGVHSVIVDGAPLAGNVIPAYGDGQLHHVEVVLG